MADSTERLLLQVDAATELLRRHLSEGEGPIDRFERRAVKMSETVDRAIGSMGSKFGAFAGLADDAAKRAERSFEASFSQVQRIAAQAIKGPTIDGRVNLGADDIRAGAAAAQEQARSFELIGEAAQRAAARVGDTSEATRLFIQATAASRNEAQQKANALLAEAGALERVEIELRQSAEATDLFVTKHQRLAGATAEQGRLATSAAQAALEQRSLAAAADVVRAELDPMYLAQKRFNDELDRAEALLAAGVLRQHEYDAAVSQSRSTLNAHAVAVAGSSSASKQLVNSSGAVRAAMQGVSYQVQDTFTQLSMGANVFQVVAIQGGQLAGQFSNLEGKAGNVARFLIGPWGLAFTAALLVLGPVVGKLLDMNSALDEATDKLKKDAEESEVTRRAKERFSRSIDGVTESLRAQDEALKASATSERTAAERANVSAKILRDRALATRQATAATLADAVAQEEALQRAARDQQRYGKGEAATIAAQLADGRVSSLQDRLAKANAAVTEAEKQVNVTRVDLAAENAAISIDPVRAVTKLYDDRIRAVKEQQREEARLGRQVGAESQARIRDLENEKRAKVKAAQETQAAANRKGNNNQLGREITVADARSIVASIGGRVTSGLRSTADQERIYADKLAGRHNGPVAKPGTSDHERGKAVDVAYGPGISIASIREAFAKQGVALRQILDEPAQRVFHVAFGKKGPSREQVADRAETARQKLISDDISYTDQERAARQRLIAATRKGADSEEEKENATAEAAEVERTATRTKIADQLSAKKITKAQADQLNELNEATYTQRLQNILVDRATRTIDRQYEVAEGDLQSRLAVLRINQDMAVTAAERRAIAKQILEAEQELRRQALERVRDTSQDPKAVQSARDELVRLPTVEAAENVQSGRQSEGPLDEYRRRLHSATDDTKTALQDISVNALGSIEDSVASTASKILGLKGAFGELVNSAIADLARLAFKMAVIAALDAVLPGSGSFTKLLTGKAAGGKVAGKASGGRIVGAGSGTSDSILALIDGKEPLLVSNGESIVTAEATARYWPFIDAMNNRRLPAFAGGGYLGSAPSLPQLQSPSLPRMTGMGGRRDRMSLDVKVKTEASPLLISTVENTALRTVAGAAEPIMAGATSRTMRRLARPDLPGGIG